MVLTSQQQKTIAPKVEKSEVSSSTNNRNVRRKIAFHPSMGYAVTPVLPQKVARRNARERNRVKQVNCGFEMLRAHIPSAAKQKKMSKVDTLKHAVEYIQSLQCMLTDKNTTLTSPIPHQQNSEVNNFATQNYPLTPQTPTSMTFPSNESGYSSEASFFTNNHSGLMTPPVNVPQYHQNTTSCNSPNNHTENYSTMSTYYSTHQDYYQPQPQHQEHDDEELLDVIAKWTEN